MSFCPQCHEEYDGSVAQCADCEVALVDSLAESDAPTHGKLICRDVEVAQALLERLLEDGVDAELLPEPVDWADGSARPVVQIPIEAAGLVALVVQQSGRFQLAVEHVAPEDGTEPRTMIDFADTSGAGSIESHPWMRKKPSQIVQMGDEAVPEIATLAADGTPEVCRWACRRLVEMGPTGVEALRQTIWTGVHDAARERVFTAIRAFDDAAEHGAPIPRGVADTVITDLGSGEPAVRMLASLVIGRFGEPAHVEPLVPLLLDPEPLVLDEVVEALDHLTDIDVGLDGDADDDARARAQERIRSWIADSV